MTRDDRRLLDDLHAADYLTALSEGDLAAQLRLSAAAARRPGLLAAIDETLSGWWDGLYDGEERRVRR